MTADDAIGIRQARRARVRTIRGRVIGYSVALFAIVWSLIAVLLVTGHDPVLSRQTAASPASSSGAGSTGSSATGEGESEDSGSGSAGLATGSGSSNTAGSSSAGSSNSTGSGGLVSPSPVTSGQS